MKWTIRTWWAYVVELLLSSLIVWCAILVFGLDAVTRFSQRIGLTAVTVLGAALFAASAGMLVSVAQRIESPFYQWLEGKGRLDAYMNAFKYVAFVCVGAIAMVVIVNPVSPTNYLAVGALFFLVLLGINAVTFLNNVTGLIRLEMAFKKKLGR